MSTLKPGWVSRKIRARSLQMNRNVGLEMIRDHIAANLSIEKNDFDYAPFTQEGGIGKVYQLFGDELNKIIEELNDDVSGMTKKSKPDLQDNEKD